MDVSCKENSSSSTGLVENLQMYEYEPDMAPSHDEVSYNVDQCNDDSKCTRNDGRGLLKRQKFCSSTTVHAIVGDRKERIGAKSYNQCSHSEAATGSVITESTMASTVVSSFDSLFDSSHTTTLWFDPTSSSVQNQEKETFNYAATALALTVQDWRTLGRDVGSSETDCTGDLDILVDRITSLLLVRVAAVASASASRCDQSSGTSSSSTSVYGSVKKNPYPDYSTSTICRTLLMEQQSWDYFTPTVTQKVIEQLRTYVYRILSGYNDVPYHNREHAFHVVLSSNKLLDMMLQQPQHLENKKASPHPTYGLRQDPIQLMGLMFAALVHDVEHLGIPNRQLSLESDPLAVQYNDFSIAEQRSLYIAFHEFLQDDYIELRTTMFGTSNVGVDATEYRRFRNSVVNLVLNTDIASPERTQLAKSKWKEAFGEKIKFNPTNGTESSTEASETADADRPKEQSSRRIRPRRIRPSEATERSALHRREKSESSEDDYTIPVTPDYSVCDDIEIDDDDDDDDDDDGVIYHSTLNASGASEGQTTSKVAGSCKIIHQLQNEKLDRLITLATREDSIDKTCIGDEHPDEEDLERQQLYGNQKYKQSHREGPRLQKSSSLPGKLYPPIPVIDCLRLGPRNSLCSRQRQMSAPQSIHLHRKRLGIRRSMDLSGESLETYKRKLFHRFLGEDSVENEFEQMLMHDQPDELKASVVLELILTAADVAHNLQGWDQMVKWSGRLYMELRKAFVTSRSSFDPQARWYENQIGFLESYLLPLAERMIETGVFADGGINFVETVKGNRDRWIAEGVFISKGIIEAGASKYPPNVQSTTLVSENSTATGTVNVVTSEAESLGIAHNSSNNVDSKSENVYEESVLFVTEADDLLVVDKDNTQTAANQVKPPEEVSGLMGRSQNIHPICRRTKSPKEYRYDEKSMHQANLLQKPLARSFDDFLIELGLLVIVAITVAIVGISDVIKSY